MAGSVWVRLDVGYFRNTKIRRAGTDAALLHLAAICYLGEQGKGTGVLPADDVDLVATSVRIRRPQPVIDRLVKCGLWHEAGGDWLIHDYRTTNGDDSPAAKARERQERWRAAKQAKRDSKRLSRDGGET